MSKIEVSLYSKHLPALYNHLLPSELLPLLQELPSSYIALGAHEGTQTIGLAIASLHREEGRICANLSSIVISEPYRRKGIGSKLYSMLETVLRQQGATLVRSQFVAESRLLEEQSAFLTRCGFASPVPGIHIWSGPLHQVFHELSWVPDLKLSSEFTLVPFSRLTSPDRARIAVGRSVWYPSLLDPFQNEGSLDTQRSLVLYFQDEPVGWVILERFDERTVLFKTMFVKEAYRQRARGLALAVEAYRRLITEDVYTEGIFFVEADNNPMVKLMHRKIDHAAIQRQVLWKTEKSL